MSDRPKDPWDDVDLVFMTVLRSLSGRHGGPEKYLEQLLRWERSENWRMGQARRKRWEILKTLDTLDPDDPNDLAKGEALERALDELEGEADRIWRKENPGLHRDSAKESNEEFRRLPTLIQEYLLARFPDGNTSITVPRQAPSNRDPSFAQTIADRDRRIRDAVRQAILNEPLGNWPLAQDNLCREYMLTAERIQQIGDFAALTQQREEQILDEIARRRAANEPKGQINKDIARRERKSVRTIERLITCAKNDKSRTDLE